MRNTRAGAQALRFFSDAGNDSFDSGRGTLYAVWVRWSLLVGLLLLVACLDAAQVRAQVSTFGSQAEPPAPTQPASGTCLGGNCQVGAPAVQQQDLWRRRAPPTRGFAHGAAWLGAIGGALSLGGSIAIASLNDHDHEIITRGIWVGFTTLAVPVVAIGSYTTRKRARVEGVRGLRTVGWTAYMGAVGNGVAQWYLVLVDARPTPGFTIGLGVLGLLSFFPHAFDAFVSGRAARAKGLARLSPTASGFAVRF